AGAGLRGCARGGDRQRRRRRGGAGDGERRREGAADGQRVQQDEDGDAAKRPRDRDQQPGLRRRARAGCVLTQPAADLPAADEIEARDARKAQDERRSGNAGGRDEREARLDAARAGRGGGDRRHRRERGAVEQADDEQRQADRAEPRGLLAGQPADDRDADRLVEPAGERDAPDGGGAAGGGEGQRFGGLLLREGPLPAPRLEGARGEEEDDGGGDDERVAAPQ